MSSENEIALLYVTVPNVQVAKDMAHALLDARMIACANIFGEVTSLYDWDGAREETSEIAMLLKTTRAQREAAMQRIKQLHPYEIPCILCLGNTDAEPSFAQWVIKAIK